MKLLITAGPTHEHLDPVRYLANASSGRMGYALAREAHRKGHQVTLVSGPTALKDPDGISMHRVVSAEEMRSAVMRALPSCDCLIMAAAVSDFRPASASATKLPREGDRLSLDLVRTPDIIAEARRAGPDKVIVGFSLETERTEERARRKMEAKGADLVVQNAPETIGADRIACRLLFPDGRSEAIGPLAKSAAARRIVRAAEKIWEDRNPYARRRKGSFGRGR